MNNGAAFEGHAPAALHDAVTGSAVALALGQSFTPIHGLASHAGEVHADFSYQVTGKMPATGTAWDRVIIVPIEAVWAVHGLHAENHQAPFVPGLLDG